ncbi:MAG TPA: hypothetical protein VFA94_13665, partial [Acidimicrobiales bacterium]|nr:hypothetical protein [Acidimicrobiales bacterium]
TAPPPPPAPAPATGPSAPAVISPTGGAAVVQPFNLLWGTSTGTTRIVAYNWQVSNNATFTGLVLQGSTASSTLAGLPPTQAKVSGLSNGAYFWRVDAVQDASDPIVGLVTGPWSATASFTVTGSAPGTPAAPVMINPPNLFQYHPFEFVRNEWLPVPGADHYLLEYDNEPTFTLPLFNADFSPIPASQTTAPIMFGEPVGNLWFRVRAVSADGTRSLPSNVRQVTITFTAPLPPPPLLVGPPDGASGQTVTFDWADDANPQSYELQIGSDRTFAAANAAECTGLDWCVRGIPESQWTLPRDNPGLKFWRVRSEHGDSSPTTPALSGWSAVRSFNLLPTPPAIAGVRIDAFTDRGLTLRSHTNAFSGTTPDNTVVGRIDVTNTVVPPGGVVATLQSSDTSVATVPPTVLIPPTVALDADITTASFPIDPQQVTTSKTVTITATLPTGAKSAILTVDPPSVRRIEVEGSAVAPVLAGGDNPPAAVVLNGAAPSAGAVVTFASNSAAIPPPAPVHVAAGASSAPFTLATNPVAATTTVTLTASWGTSSVPLSVTLHPAPTLLTPANGATFTVGQPVSFSWTEELVDDEIQVATSPSFAAPVVDQIMFATPSFTANGLPGGTLFWRARAYDSAFRPGPWSAARTLTVNAPPGPLAAPVLSLPAAGARVAPGQAVTLSWQAVSGAASYLLQVDDSSAFTVPLVLGQPVTGTQFTTSFNKANLSWRVRAVDGTGNPGTWSAVRSLTVK